MNTVNPRMTIDNLPGTQWLVTVDHTFPAGQAISVKVLLPKSAMPVPNLQKAAVQVAIGMLQDVLNGIPPMPN